MGGFAEKLTCFDGTIDFLSVAVARACQAVVVIIQSSRQAEKILAQGIVTTEHVYLRRCVNLEEAHGLIPGGFDVTGNKCSTHDVEPGSDPCLGKDVIGIAA